MIKRILSCIVCLCMVMGCVLTAAATNVESIKQQQQALEQQSAEYQAILDQKNAEVEKQQEYVDALVGKVETVTQEIQLSHQKIQKLDDQIAEKTKQIDAKNAEIEENMDILRQRIKTIYLAGDVSSLEIIMGAKNFTDFLDKVQLVKSVSAHDEKLINDIQAQLDQISEEKVALFTGESIAYSIVYNFDKKLMTMRSCAMTDEGPDNDSAMEYLIFTSIGISAASPRFTE